MALLEIESLSKRFFEYPALDNVSLTVQSGELLGIIGPNGSGKTTLFNCISGVLRPSSGAVRFHGRDVTGFSSDKVFANGISRTFQLIQIFALKFNRHHLFVAKCQSLLALKTDPNAPD